MLPDASFRLDDDSVSPKQSTPVNTSAASSVSEPLSPTSFVLLPRDRTYAIDIQVTWDDENIPEQSRQHVLRMRPFDSVHMLKTELTARTGLPVPSQRLFDGCAELNDHNGTLLAAGVGAGSRLTLRSRPELDERRYGFVVPFGDMETHARPAVRTLMRRVNIGLRKRKAQSTSLSEPGTAGTSGSYFVPVGFTGVAGAIFKPSDEEAGMHNWSVLCARGGGLPAGRRGSARCAADDGRGNRRLWRVLPRAVSGPLRPAARAGGATSCAQIRLAAEDGDPVVAE
ncbi:MAG: hypothetical protein MHM6MM_008029 [Cercozoa sp. M6MM]